MFQIRWAAERYELAAGREAQNWLGSYLPVFLTHSFRVTFLCSPVVVFESCKKKKNVQMGRRKHICRTGFDTEQ